MSWQDFVELVKSIAPYIVPSVLLFLLDRRRRKSEIRKVDTESDNTLVQAAEKLVNTGGTLVSQLEKQLVMLDIDYQKAVNSLERINRLHDSLKEQFENLSLQHVELREKMGATINSLAEKDRENKNLRKCVQWLLFYLRKLSDGSIDLPKPWELERWISRSDELNGLEYTDSLSEEAKDVSD